MLQSGEVGGGGGGVSGVTAVGWQSQRSRKIEIFKNNCKLCTTNFVHVYTVTPHISDNEF